jgi:hypothetical protein
MKIGIEINGVLRNTIGKFKDLYEKHLLDSTEFESNDKTYEITFSGDTEEVTEMNENVDVNLFKYEILSDVTSLELNKHFAFPSKDEIYSFMYEEYTMELFGHAPSAEMNTFNVLNELYYNLRDEYELVIVSDEIGKSKPASLFFLAKFGCLIEKVVFYSEITKNNMWNEIDVLLTASPTNLTNVPENKTVVKYNTNYNKEIKSEFEISTLSDFNLLLNKINKNDVYNI